jgi:catechol 2,3-dioxygenase-like lactoylglutathione lyase family enzyme
MSASPNTVPDRASTPHVESTLGIKRMHHVGISTLDIDRLLAFYTDTLGFEQVDGFAWEPGFDDVDAALALRGSSGTMAMLRLGSVYLELFEFSNPRPEAGDPNRSIASVGINHVCLLVDDIDSIVRHLNERGVTMHASPRDIGDGPFVYCRDPDGNPIEFWQSPTSSPEEEQ